MNDTLSLREDQPWPILKVGAFFVLAVSLKNATFVGYWTTTN